MRDITQILSRIESGDSSAADQLLPLVYEELRKLAAARLAKENSGQTLQPTDLVHDAYLRLVDGNQANVWPSRRYFFSAAAEAMRRILVERARHKGRLKHGGGLQRVELEDAHIADESQADQLLAIDECLEKLAQEDSLAAEVLKLRYFAGMSVAEAADALGIHRATANRHWVYARAWIRAELLEPGREREI